MFATSVALYSCKCFFIAIRAGIQLEDSQSRYGCCMNYSRSTFTIHLRRKYMYYVFNLIMPYFLFSIIAVCTFLLPPSRTERLTLGTAHQLQINNDNVITVFNSIGLRTCADLC